MSERETVWVGVRQGYDHESTELFKDRDAAMRWLRRAWYDRRRDAALTYWFALDYWGEENPDVRIVTSIEEGYGGFAEFREDGGGDRWFVQGRELRDGPRTTPASPPTQDEP
jgi:hypothetical protein